MNQLLEMEQVDAYYGAAHVLHGVTLNVAAGERVALVGRNGVGKTTVANTILGVAMRQRGILKICGRETKRLRHYSAARLGISIVPQGRQIVANLTIEENLLLGAGTRRAGPWNLERVCQLFPVLKERAHMLGTALSGGEQQMLAIGRALMANPALLILDEPSEGLAPVIADRLADVLNEVAEQGMALLLIEQNLLLVTRVAQRYYVMAKGTVVEEGAMAGIDIQDLHKHIIV